MLERTAASPAPTKLAFGCAITLALWLSAGCGDDDPMSDAGVDMSTDTVLPTDCDVDADCDDGLFCNGAETCVEGVCVLPEAPECDDGIECSVDACDEARDACSNNAPDMDGDGVGDMACVGADGPLGTDCDDGDATRFPGNTEVCDEPADGAMFGVDEDCDPSTFGEVDMDGDGAFDAVCTNGDEDTGAQSSGGDDCNDEDLTVLPGQLEICDSVDNDCDTEIDEAENSVLWYPDTDGDLFGDPDGPEILSCSPIADHSIRATDCDDTRPTVNPAGTETCNGIDDDCDGTLDEGLEDCAPCDPNPCANDGSCRVLSMSEFVCECRTGFVGETCEESCDVGPAFPEAPDGRPGELNHVRSAVFYSSESHRDDSTCEGPCASVFAADGQRCGDSTLAPIYQTGVSRAGQLWRADWSLRGAQRIDRIEVYALAGSEAAGLDGAEIFVDNMRVATYPAGEPSEAFIFDPPIYGSSVEVRKTASGELFGVAEVEVWGQSEAAVTDIAFLGAVRQSSVLAVSEGVDGSGTSANAGPMNAVDGDESTESTTKPFLRAGTLAIDVCPRLGFPYNTGNLDDPPMVGRDAAWWLLDFERPQTIRSLQIHRGSTPARLDGAEVYVVVDGELESPARWTLPSEGDATTIEVLRPDAPLENITAIKIVAAEDSGAFPGEAESSLQLREVRVWADTPMFGTEPLRDLTTRARANQRWELFDRIPPLNNAPSRYIDGNTESQSTTTLAQMDAPAFVHLRFSQPHEIRRIDVYNRNDYLEDADDISCTGTCRRRSRCSSERDFGITVDLTSGGCSYQSLGAEIRELDATAGAIGDVLGTLGFEHFSQFAIDTDASSYGIEITKREIIHVEVDSCRPNLYPTRPFVSAREFRVMGYWGAAGPSRLNYAALSRVASVSRRPSLGEDLEAERAINGWTRDHSGTTGDDQELVVELARPVLAESIQIEGPDMSSTGGTRVDVRIDGGEWETIATLPELIEHSIRLTGDRLISAVRLRRSGADMKISRLELLALPRY